MEHSEVNEQHQSVAYTLEGSYLSLGLYTAADDAALVKVYKSAAKFHKWVDKFLRGE